MADHVFIDCKGGVVLTLNIKTAKQKKFVTGQLIKLRIPARGGTR